jgi:hypothetical protein
MTLSDDGDIIWDHQTQKVIVGERVRVLLAPP